MPDWQIRAIALVSDMLVSSAKKRKENLQSIHPNRFQIQTVPAFHWMNIQALFDSPAELDDLIDTTISCSSNGP